VNHKENVYSGLYPPNRGLFYILLQTATQLAFHLESHIRSVQVALRHFSAEGCKAEGRIAIEAVLFTLHFTSTVENLNPLRTTTVLPGAFTK
jgi:hypothetical protein